MNDLISQLIELAQSKGVCNEGYSIMSKSNLEQLVDYYIQNPDWCLERDFPTLEYLRENFSNIEDKGVYVGHVFHGEVLNDLQTYIFHKCKGTIKVGLNVDKAIIPMLYIANDCRLRIVGIGSEMALPSEVPLYVFGENSLSARNNRYVKFNIYKTEMI